MCNLPSFVLPGVSKCCVSPNCELSLLTTPPSSPVCCVKYTLCHGGQGNKGRHSLKLRYTGTLSFNDWFGRREWRILLTYNSNLQVGSYFYDRNSVTCTSEFRDPKQSRESTERALQHSVKFRNLPKAQRIVRWQQRVINRVQRMVKFNKIAKMGFLAQAGFRQLCRLWVPDLTSEEAPATDLSSINNQHQEEEDNNHDVSDLHPLLPLCVCVLDKLCDRPKGSFWWFSTAVSIETRKELGPRVSHSVLKIPQHCLGIGGTLQKTALQRNKRWRVAKLCIAGSSNTCSIMLMPKMSLLNSCLGSFVSSSALHRSA